MYFTKPVLSLLGAATLSSSTAAKNSMHEEHVQTSIATNGEKQDVSIHSVHVIAVAFISGLFM